MGYIPIYWFTNHNSSFGSESEIRNLITVYRNHGVDIMEDVVVNHRGGVSTWTNFPTETWGGRTWHIGADGICSNDEVAGASDQERPTGAADTGEGFDGARDLDHTNANVQNNVKNYCRFLLEDMGYAGFRLDMVKGYGGEYTKIYNEYSKPKYSVGEYFDGNYDLVSAWIERTGKTSAAFDFPLKFALNDAFNNGDMTKLVWKANWTTDQPAGLIHFMYQRYAVTFIDNHDTYKDHNKFGGPVGAAYAFILCSPGTPCVFWEHWKSNQEEIKRLIDVRNSAGLHNESPVRVLQTDASCYMAEVTGTRGKVVVKVGPAMVSPAGYSNDEIKASGTDYCVWYKPSEAGAQDSECTVYFDNSKARWTTPHIHYWGASESKWPGVAMKKFEGNVWKYTVPKGTTGLLFNAGDGDATKTSDFQVVANHIYDTTGDKGGYEGAARDNLTNAPSALYILGNLKGSHWTTNSGIEMSRNGNVYKAAGVALENSATPGKAGDAYFTFVTKLGGNWNEVNAADRFGASTQDEELPNGIEADITPYLVNVNASSAKSWKLPAGIYDITADFDRMKVKATPLVITGVDEIKEGSYESLTRYFSLEGIELNSIPESGIYIRVQNGKTEKVAAE